MITSKSVDYLEKCITDPKTFKSIVDDAAKVITEKQIPFDAIACRGVSGLLISGPLSIVLNKPMIIVRKKVKEQVLTHSCYEVEIGCVIRPTTKYLIVDDLIDFGSTVKAIIDDINIFVEKHNKEWDFAPQRKLPDYECVGIFTYHWKSTTMEFEHCGQKYPHFHGNFAEWQ